MAEFNRNEENVSLAFGIAFLVIFLLTQISVVAFGFKASVSWKNGITFLLAELIVIGFGIGMFIRHFRLKKENRFYRHFLFTVNDDTPANRIQRVKEWLETMKRDVAARREKEAERLKNGHNPEEARKLRIKAEKYYREAREIAIHFRFFDPNEP